MWRPITWKDMSTYPNNKWPKLVAPFFCATACKTVWFALCYGPSYYMGPLSVLSVCLSVPFLHFGQTVGWNKMPLGADVGLGPGYIVLDGDPAPTKGAQPPLTFRPMSTVAKRSPISAIAELLLQFITCWGWLIVLRFYVPLDTLLCYKIL